MDHIDKFGFDDSALSLLTLAYILAQEDWPVWPAVPWHQILPRRAHHPSATLGVGPNPLTVSRGPDNVMGERAGIKRGWAREGSP